MARTYYSENYMAYDADSFVNCCKNGFTSRMYDHFNGSVYSYNDDYGNKYITAEYLKPDLAACFEGMTAAMKSGSIQPDQKMNVIERIIRERGSDLDKTLNIGEKQALLDMALEMKYKPMEHLITGSFTGLEKSKDSEEKDSKAPEKEKTVPGKGVKRAFSMKSPLKSTSKQASLEMSM